jgi:hypothetical protein
MKWSELALLKKRWEIGLRPNDEVITRLLEEMVPDDVPWMQHFKIDFEKLTLVPAPDVPDDIIGHGMIRCCHFNGPGHVYTSHLPELVHEGSAFEGNSFVKKDG